MRDDSIKHSHVARATIPPHPGIRAFGLVVLAVVAAWYLGIDPRALADGWPNLLRLAEDAFPPQMGVLPTAIRGLVETLAIAFLGTMIGVVLALPLALLASRTLFPIWLVAPARLIAASVRTLPSLLWAVLMVILVGFGPLAGVLAMGLYTTGHLAKLAYEALEGLPSDAFEALGAAGATRLQLARLVALPEASNQLLSHALYMLEYNVRASAIVGFVGAGGIGAYLSRYLQMMQYDGVVTLLGVVFVTVVVMDALSLWVRSRFITAYAPAQGRSARYRPTE